MPTEIVLIAKSIAKKGSEDTVKKELLSLVAPTRKEKGCILYNFHIETDNKNTFVFYEIWENKEALDKHIQTNSFKNVMNKINDLLEKPMEVIFLNKQ
jgi:quinol monooxygenase YgiN